MTKSRAVALAAAIVIAAAVVVVVSMNRGHSNTSSSDRLALSPSTRSSDSSVGPSESSGGDSRNASSTAQPETGPTSRPRPTYERGEAGGIYLDLLPAEEGDSEDRDKSLGRLTRGATRDFGKASVHSSAIGFFRFRISSGNGTPVNRTVRIGGPNAQDFSPPVPDSCEQKPCPWPTGGFHCSAAVCFCSKSVCQFGMNFSPSAVGRRSATLLIGDTPYVLLTGVGLPESREERETSTSTSSTSVSTSSATSTSSSSVSMVRPPSRTATTYSPATS
jgi:hypothetical protein